MKTLLCIYLDLITPFNRGQWAYVSFDENGIGTIDKVHTLVGGRVPVECKIDPMGQYCALLKYNTTGNSLSLYNFVTQAEQVIVSISNTTEGLAISPNGRYLAVQHRLTSSRYLTIMSLIGSAGSFNSQVNNYGFQPAFSPDGSFLAIPYLSSPFLKILGVNDAISPASWLAVSGTPTLSNAGHAADWSPDGSLLAVTISNSPFLRVYNTSNWSLVDGTPTLPGTCTRFKFSPDGTMIGFSIPSQNKMVIYNTADWSIKFDNLFGKTNLDFTADSRFVAGCSDISPYLRIYNTTTGGSHNSNFSFLGTSVVAASFSKIPIVYALSGTTRNRLDQLESREIRLYSRNTGKMIDDQFSSNPDGSFHRELIWPVDDYLQRVVLSNSNEAPYENDIIDRLKKRELS